MGSRSSFRFRGLNDSKLRMQRILKRAQESGVVQAFSEEVRKKLVSTIEQQGFRHAQLSKDWKARKARMGMDYRTLIASGDYINSIYTGQTSTGFFVSTPDYYSKLAAWLEFGTRTMVARPHWRPTMEWASQQWGLVVRKYGEDILK